jgi:sigma-E factor negative regulatory protein RseA
MNKQSLEHLSSLMDGEMSRETGLFMTRRLSSDAELCEAWKRYHLIRDCLRRPGGGAAVLDLSDRVQSALGEEASPSQVVAGRRWIRPMSGVAIAASVALLAIVMVGPGRVQGPETETAPAISEAVPFTSPNSLNATPVSQPASFSPRLNSYLLRHNQLARSSGQQGFVSLVPMMSAQAQAEEERSAGEEPERGDNAQEAANTPR